MVGSVSIFCWFHKKIPHYLCCSKCYSKQRYTRKVKTNSGIAYPSNVLTVLVAYTAVSHIGTNSLDYTVAIPLSSVRLHQANTQFGPILLFY